jgi:hypothetical protein
MAAGVVHAAQTVIQADKTSFANGQSFVPVVNPNRPAVNSRTQVTALTKTSSGMIQFGTYNVGASDGTKIPPGVKITATAASDGSYSAPATAHAPISPVLDLVWNGSCTYGTSTIQPSSPGFLYKRYSSGGVSWVVEDPCGYAEMLNNGDAEDGTYWQVDCEYKMKTGAFASTIDPTSETASYWSEGQFDYWSPTTGDEQFCVLLSSADAKHLDTDDTTVLSNSHYAQEFGDGNMQCCRCDLGNEVCNVEEVRSDGGRTVLARNGVRVPPYTPMK